MDGDTTVLRKVLITGGSGFVGSAIARAFAEHPACAITVVDLTPPGPTHVVPEQASFIKADITVQDEICRAVCQVEPEVLIHTAGFIPPLSERFGRKLQALVWKVNVQGTKNVLEAAKRAGVQALIYTSSCCVITDDLGIPHPNIDEQWPVSPSSLIYGESKAAAEASVLKASADTLVTCALRPSVLCGPGDHQLVPAIHACIAKFETPFVIGDGFNLWDVTYVTNVADAHVLAAENLLSSKTAAGEVFFIQNNEPVPFRDFCLAIWAHFGHYPPIELHIPQTLAYIAGFLSECFTWLRGTTTLSRGSARDACSVRYASGEKAKRILGYEARVGFDDAVRLSCEDYARRLGIELPAQKTKY
ncbi:hypothetical protein ASPZODRAFT_1846814 [Penicilliopsis zonata CBS 506.65]|uniref:3-beta hydroxysteroid dehydrogenase/isomerase domain-containing protein n=1 Tax=Penicilliopsis zonata CBS 506.65 TaxID=1073090 RepID=A0A1L9SID6_9EURO|nr:hypothetical protein ASPZODRAFT_1846814 [Penicilliopsis zonata CBS 506.65]OJJ46907.1 hypothetical protein ASPZODRAFT_1846814 [Penicilliopsis zonata CBS 506.65]